MQNSFLIHHKAHLVRICHDYQWFFLKRNMHMDHIDIIPQLAHMSTNNRYPIRFSLHYNDSMSAFEMHCLWNNESITIGYSNHASALCRSMCKGYYFPVKLIFIEAKVNKKE